VVRTLLALAALALPSLAHAQPLQTVAETSGYKATSKNADVLAFCEAVAKRGPTAKLDSFGTSHVGNKLPYLVIADPPVATPEEARASKKLVVLAFANIHAGEVDGKEALLALARDLTDKKEHPLLKNLVILLVPNLNPDGNDKIDPKNRGDNGPTDGAGTRANAQGLDLNRDFVKLESPEVRALMKLVNAWDPGFIIDCHTTNGSKHRYQLTYDGPRYPSYEPGHADFANGVLFPAVTKKLAAAGFDIAPYGNFNAGRTKWETYPATPRYGVQYFALRGRLCVLSESYSHAPFKTRIDVTKAFVTSCFEVVSAKERDLSRPMGASGPRPTPIRTKTEALPNKLTIKGFEEVEKDGKRVATDKHKDYELDFVANVVPTEKVIQPHAYLIPEKFAAVAQNLQRHGLTVEELREDIELDTESFTITSVDSKELGTAKRVLITDVGGEWKPKARRVPAGTFVVRTGGVFGHLATSLLEPRAEDGLTTWGAFTDALVPGKEFPVLRLPKPYPMSIGAARPLPEDVVVKPVTEAVLLPRGGGFSFGFAGSPITPGAWLDADHFLQVKGGTLLKVAARTGRGEPFADTEKIKKSLLALKDFDPKVAEKLAKATTFRTNPARTAFLFDIGADLGLAYFDGTPAVRLTTSGGTKEHVSFDAEGKRLAFVRGKNLFVVNIEKREEKQLTTDGSATVFNAKADWVYEEEIFNRSGKAYWWSPDGKQLAFIRFDDAPVKPFNLVDLAPVQGRLESYAYPKPGDPNPLVKIGVVSADGGKPMFLDMCDYKPDDTIIARVGWVGDTGTVFAYVQNRTQTWLDFVVWDAPTAKPRKLFRDSTKAWIDDPGEPHFLADGSFLFLSERTGWKHIYHYKADGKLLCDVTRGEWEVRELLRVDEAARTAYFTANYTDPTGTDLCRVTYGGKFELLTAKGDSHRVSLAPRGPLYIDRYTNLHTPTKARVVDVEKGDVRTLDTNPVRERDGYKFGTTEKVNVPIGDQILDGILTLPPDFDPKKKYPVWLFTYAGPHAPTVKNEYGGGRVLDHTLATNGVIVFRIDPQSASGKGAQSAWKCYKQLGVQELKDLEEAVAWLAKRPYIDASRVGISGHSYGGFMAAYALTHSKTFSAGIASGPVTDWKLYDTIYTERYMLTPKENPDGYAKSSVVAAARNLSGKLLIVHGMMDDNVHMQNSTQFVDALQKANKDFELMFYPNARHGIGGAHYLKLQLSFIRRALGVGK
jgi:dipeptidyl aminopeptidase/acylaminoacyl peptidase